ncbi:2-keto-4-pentenoate hydratase/2-oxohepta-3-ene-1,7-dioic acid hydratase (catechol pathway) [Rhizobiales bacterium GAS191]|jgi:2,4-diketo-3-deoxy-L-fuconate hydrolase|nr:2-keto-4-pentenoate hydratase/2-oxohepta-3-ene-1,7-dioic acid hydratase (catechol pathway) [Rhizobiales bacterium GAS191]
MRFATIRHEGSERVAVVVSDAELALLPKDLGDLVGIIQGGPEALARIRVLLPDLRQRLPLAGAALLAPLRRFRRDILCAGWNYWDHFEEGRGKREGQEVPRPEHPTFFTKSPDTVIGPNDEIGFDPNISVKWDYEAELALVIGKTGRSIPQAKAMDHVFGYLLANDVSQRDLQRAHGGQWLKGKSIDLTMPIGPFVVTADELDWRDVQLQCRVNGQVLQDASTKLMAFPLPVLIEELSFGMTVRAGDLVLTGTPAGVGNARTPPVYLTDGDEVVVSGTGIGELRNRMRETDLRAATAPGDGQS